MGLKGYTSTMTQLVVRQINSEYQVNKANMISYFAKANELLKKFEKYCITHISRA